MECDWKPQAHNQCLGLGMPTVGNNNYSKHGSCCQTVSTADISTIAVDRGCTAWL